MAMNIPQRVVQRITSRIFPPQIRTLDDYYRIRFPGMARAFRKFLAKCEIPPSEIDERPIGVIVMPWIGTACPWFAIAVAIGLAMRRRPVVLIWDDTPFHFDTLYLWDQNTAIAQILDAVGNRLQILKLSSQAPHPSLSDDSAALDRAVEMNLAWKLRGASLNETHERSKVLAKRDLANTLSYMRGLLTANTFAKLVVPGGIYGASGLYFMAAAPFDLPIVTYDADLGLLYLCQGGVAAQQSDIPLVFDKLKSSSEKVKTKVVNMAEAELAKRMSGRDRRQFQVVPYQETELPVSPTVVLPLNVDWDSAALGRHHLFAGTEEWLTLTIAFILKHFEGKIIVRQHPDERREMVRGYRNLGETLRSWFGHEPQVQFVGATDTINTYDILKRATLVLPFVSTIGVEAAIMGKPVIPCGDCYYSGLGFTWRAGSRDEYFELVLQGLRAGLGLLPDQVERAWYCYYLTQICNRTWTTFTAQATDFDKWSKISPQRLFARPEVKRVLDSIEKGVPVSWLAHEATLSNETKKDRSD